jgi:hypothetical protein
MREARTLGSWVLALFIAAMLVWIASDTLIPAVGTRNHLFPLLAETSGISYFEPTGRFVAGVLEVLAALLIFLPFTRRIGAFLALLIMALLSALLVQLMMLSVPIPVDSVGQAGQVTTSSTDASGPFYLTLGLVIAAIILIVVHPGGGDHARSGNDYYTR